MVIGPVGRFKVAAPNLERDTLWRVISPRGSEGLCVSERFGMWSEATISHDS
jgi:hypothetical protein